MINQNEQFSGVVLNLSQGKHNNYNKLHLAKL
jgi:hypothetical protein